MTGSFEIVIDGLGFVEGTRWLDGRLWFSDFGARRVRSIDRSGAMRDEAWVPGQPSGLGFTHDGALLVVSSYDQHLLRFEGGTPLVVADIGKIYRGALNDMLTLPDGRCYISAFPEPVVGAVAPPTPPDGGRVPLFMVRPDGEVMIVAQDLRIPNGMAYDPRTRLLFVAETMGQRILAFDMKDDGSLGVGQSFGDIGERSPDGIALDGRGRLWVACPFSSEFIRLDDGGAIDTVLTVPDNAWAVTCAVGENDDELWCAVVATSFDDYLQGRAKGSIGLWRSD